MDTQVRLSSEQAPQSAAKCAIMREVPYREAVAPSTGPRFRRAVISPSPSHCCSLCTKPQACLLGDRQAHLLLPRGDARPLALVDSYGETRRTLEGYVDADGSMAKDRRAITSYAFLTKGGAVSWSSKRLEIILLSTTESEYVAANQRRAA